MDRITYVTIANQTYPLNFSVSAADEVIARYGSISGINQAMGFTQAEKNEEAEQPKEVEKEQNGQTYHEAVWLLALLMQQGAEYKRIMKEDTPIPLTTDELETVLSRADVVVLLPTVLNAVTVGISVTVETEANEKNAETAQSN